MIPRAAYTPDRPYATRHTSYITHTAAGLCRSSTNDLLLALRAHVPHLPGNAGTSPDEHRQEPGSVCAAQQQSTTTHSTSSMRSHIRSPAQTPNQTLAGLSLRYALARLDFGAAPRSTPAAARCPACSPDSAHACRRRRGQRCSGRYHHWTQPQTMTRKLLSARGRQEGSATSPNVQAPLPASRGPTP